MKNVLLLVPKESYRAQAFVVGAYHLGVSLTIASQDPLPMAHRMGGNALVVSLEQPETAVRQIEEASKDSQFDAIVSIDDTGLKTAALASKLLGLKHISSATTALAQNKIAMRKRLRAAGVRQPKFETVTDDDDIAAKLSSLGGPPVILKPATLSGSIGVVRANSARELHNALPLVRSIQAAHGCTSESPIIIEQYIDGQEYAVEAIVIAGTLQILAIFDKPKPLHGPYFAETIYVTPTSLSHQERQELSEALDLARASLGIETGPIHAEFRITASGEIYFVELAARSIGGTCSKAVPLAGGTTIEELILAESLGIVSPNIAFENQASGVYMIPVPRGGKLMSISGIEEAEAVRWVTGVDMTYAAGSDVLPIPYDAKYLGFIFSKAPTAKTVVKALEQALQELEMEII